MRRKRKIQKIHQPDVQYNNIAASRFINYLMSEGKNRPLKNYFIKLFANIQKETKKTNRFRFLKRLLKTFRRFWKLCPSALAAPIIRCPEKFGRKENFFLACRWIIEAARAKKRQTNGQEISRGIDYGLKNEGAAI